MLRPLILLCVAGVLLTGCNSNVLRTLGTATAGAVVGQVMTGAMSGGASFGGGDLEGCDSPQALRNYLDHLKAGNLAGGTSTARQHCRTFRSIRPLNNEPCESIGYGYKACPALADGSTRVWTVGRRPGVGTGLN